MVVIKHKKVTKYRAHTTHGGGHRKKRRGAGSRGGRGRAGSGKRASHKKAGGIVIKGRNGFRPRRTIVNLKTVNVGYFTKSIIAKLLKENLCTKEGDLFIINLNKLGYHKLLGTGKVNLKLKIIVNSSTTKAVKKVEEVGGKIESGVVNIISSKKESEETKKEA